jgi:enamine deaminase RidA (YjgF/YER057c/UK114 family)
MASQKRLHVPPPMGFGPLPFSSGVLAGETFYLSGHIGIDPATKKVPPDPEPEARLMLDSFRETLAQGGCAMDDLVYVQIFCSDVSLFQSFNAIYRTYFEKDLPARAFIGSGPLLFGARFEIQGIAVKRAIAKRAAKRKIRHRR